MLTKCRGSDYSLKIYRRNSGFVKGQSAKLQVFGGAMATGYVEMLMFPEKGTQSSSLQQN
jgi:hypothetical protein